MNSEDTFVRDTGAPLAPLPKGSWDCQVLVYGDPARHPPRKQAAYKVIPAQFPDLARMEAALGIGYVSIVQASIYGTDHSALLDVLRSGEDGTTDGITYRGIAIVDDDVSDRTLEELNESGVRGVRFNFWKALNVVPSLDTFRRTLDRIQAFGWHVRVHVTEPELLELQDEFRSIKVPIVMDHMGHLPFAGGLEQPGVKVILDLLERENWWMMLSHGDRNSGTGYPWDDSHAFARAYLRAAPDRCVWASDWPHPGYEGPAVDDAELINLLFRQIEDPDARYRVLVENPARLHREPR